MARTAIIVLAMLLTSVHAVLTTGCATSHGSSAPQPPGETSVNAPAGNPVARPADLPIDAKTGQTIAYDALLSRKKKA